MTNRRLRTTITAVLGAAGLLLGAQRADAQVVRVTSGDATRNVVSFNVGYFWLTGLDSRDADDVLLWNLDELAFRIEDFNGATFGGEYHVAAGHFFEFGGGINYYSNSVDSVYADFVNDNGSEIRQELKLRVVPITATARFFPIGRNAAVQPYVGGGIGILPFKYSETGEFVDFSDGSIFSDRFISSGTGVGPLILAGVRVPVGDAFAIGGEIRHQWGKGDLDDPGFLSDRIDLGGTTGTFTVQVKF